MHKTEEGASLKKSISDNGAELFGP